MSANSISEYVEGLNTDGKQCVNEFIDFMSREYPQLKPKISFSMPMWLAGKKMKEGYVAISLQKIIFLYIFPMRNLLPSWQKRHRPVKEERDV